jgi:hypothetical protein
MDSLASTRRDKDMTTNFANSSPFSQPGYDWRQYANSLFEQQGQAPKYDLSTPTPSFQTNINNVWGSTAQSPFAGTQALAQQHSAALTAPPASTPPTSAPSSGGGFGFGGGMPANYQHQAPTMRDYQKNPYLDQMAGQITTSYNNNLQQNILPAIRGGVAVAGGIGGSRQGIAEGQAIGQSNQGLASALTGMYGQDFQADRNRALQQYQADQNYMAANRGMDVQLRAQDIGWNMGQRGMDLQAQGLRDNFYTAQRGQDLTQMGIGTNFYGDLLRTAASGGQAPTNNTGFDWQKAAGGFMGGMQFGQNMGWWGK